MVRVLRYPRLFFLCCTATVVCALLRDICVSASLHGYARMLLFVTCILLALTLILMSCRFFVDAQGVGIGFLTRVHRTRWENLAALGVVQCNSRRRYLYGMYTGSADFLNMLHHAPRCGPWGFVVPVSKRLLCAVRLYCPLDPDLSSPAPQKRDGRLRPQWHHALLYTLMLIPAIVVALITGAVMLLAAARASKASASLWLTLGALLLLLCGITLFHKLINTLFTCPAFNETGVCAGPGLYLPWEEVRFGYVHRVGKISGMFLLSQPLDAVRGHGTPPVLCLSMPDTTTLLLAYLTYCPHASKGLEI